MIPGSWVIISSGRDSSATACGVTPQAQKTGTSPDNGDGVPIVGSAEVGDPDGLRIADVEGGAMGVRIACAHLVGQPDLRLGIGRIVTTIRPWKRPAGRQRGWR